MNSEFLPQKGNYKKLIVYQKAECIYDINRIAQKEVPQAQHQRKRN